MPFARGSNPIWFEVDLTAHAFDDTFYMFVLQNQIPYLPAVVYHDINGTIPWNFPIQFNANGTLPIDIFFDTSVIYRLEFRQGNSQSDPLIYLVENYQPGSGGSTPIDTVAFDTDNEITNPQFSLLNVRVPYSLTATNPPAIEVAPGWFLNLTGTGTVAIDRVSLNDTLANITNTPYALRITLSGTWTGTPYLSQRFDQNGMLWSNKYVSNSVTARVEGAPQSISGVLYDSNGTLLTTVLASVPIDDTFNEYTGYGLVPATTNPDLPPAAWVEYRLLLPTAIDIYVSSFQIKSSALPIAFTFEQDTIERGVDHTFHYYKPQLEYKPIPSYAIGWDFPFNPSQLYGTTITATALGANKSRYIADQTIAFEAVSNTLNYTISSPNGLSVFTGATTQFAIIQYLDSRTARELLAQRMCVGLKGILNSGTLNGTVSLYWTTDGSLPNIATGTNNSLVATMTAGKPATFNGNWTEVTRANSLGGATFTLNNTYQELTFNQFESATGFDTATFFAIVIGFNAMPSTQSLAIEYITLQGGDIATPPAPLSFNQTLAALEAYYETSYQTGSIAGAVTSQSEVICPMNFTVAAGNISLNAVPFSHHFRSAKRTTPNVNLYSPDTGLGDTVRGHIYTNAVARNEFNVSLSGNWAVNGGDKGFYCIPSAASNLGTTAEVSTTNPNTIISFQYVADARLGIV
jgi:hypothetical protein